MAAALPAKVPPGSDRGADSGEDNEKDSLIDVSGTSEEEEEDPKPEEAAIPQCLWKLALGQSVYSEGLVVPLVAPVMRRSSLSLIYVSTFILLFVNGLLQLAILEKISELSDSKKASVSDQIFSLCHKQTADELPVQGLEGGGKKWYNCGPLTASIFSSMGQLDLNKDGKWTAAEASAVQNRWETHSAIGKVSDVPHAFEYFAGAARQGKLKGQEGEDLSSAAGASENFTAIPMSWVLPEANELSLCITTDANLCGNVEARGLLAAKIPDEKTVMGRVRKCREILSTKCPEVFGEVFDFYVRRTGELCGDVESTFDERKRVITTEYSLAARYTTGNNSVLTPYYEEFLVLALLIWWMSMVVEIRRVISWWVVLTLHPTTPPKGKDAVEICDGQVPQVNAIHVGHKVFTYLFNLLPRTYICVRLAMVGSYFLLRADGYTDLLLNTLALGFLIEVDNMLYDAVVGDDHKEMVENCKPLEVNHSHHAVTHKMHMTIPAKCPYTVFILGIAAALIYNSYNRPYGKIEMGRALNCLCQADGASCVSDHVLRSAMLAS